MHDYACAASDASAKGSLAWRCASSDARFTITGDWNSGKRPLQNKHITNAGGRVHTKAKLELAETEGFEPSIRLTAYDDLANRCLQPLGHVSAKLKTIRVNGNPALPRSLP